MREITAKPLDWVKHPTAELHRAETPFGVYDVSGMSAPPLWRFAPHSGAEWVGGQGESVEAAKAGAQAHLENVLLGMVQITE